MNRFINHHSDYYENFELKFNEKAPVLVLVKKADNRLDADVEERIPIWDKDTDEIIELLADNGFVKTKGIDSTPTTGNETGVRGTDTPTPTTETSTGSSSTEGSSNGNGEETASGGSPGENKAQGGSAGEDKALGGSAGENKAFQPVPVDREL